MQLPFAFWSVGTQPTDIPGLYAWWSNDRGVTLNGSNVSQLTDLSLFPPDGFPHNLTQGTPANQPLFDTNTLHGYATFKCDRTAPSHLDNPNGWQMPVPNVQRKTWSLFFVAKTTNNNPANAQIVFSLRNNTPGNARWAFGLGTGVGNQGWCGPVAATNFPEVVAPLGQFIQRSYIKTATDWTMYQNGVQGFAGVADTSGFDVIATVGLGLEPGNNTFGLDGSIAELFLFSETLTNDQRLSMEDYLKTKYNL